MARKEERITASHNEKNYPCGIISDKTSHPIIFQIGAEWADQHPREGLWDAEKVCKFLYKKVMDITYLNEDNTNEHYDKDEFIEDLRKAIEE